MTVVSRGERELIQRFDEFPQKARAKLEERIRGLTEELQARVQAAAPVRTGRLRSEIGSKVYTDQPNRIAGYVSVYAQDRREYPKAGALEYGSNAVGRRLSAAHERLTARLGHPGRIEAFAYLRGPFDAMKGEVESQISEALQEAAAE